MIKKTLSFLLLGGFLAAAALHPAVHAEGAGAPDHACLLSTTGPDRAAAPAVLAAPHFAVAGGLPAFPVVFPRSASVRLSDARGPPQ